MTLVAAATQKSPAALKAALGSLRVGCGKNVQRIARYKTDLTCTLGRASGGDARAAGRQTVVRHHDHIVAGIVRPDPFALCDPFALLAVEETETSLP